MLRQAPDRRRHHQKEPYDNDDTLLVIVRLTDQACANQGIGLHSNPNTTLAATLGAHTLRLGTG